MPVKRGILCQATRTFRVDVFAEYARLILLQS